MLLFLNAHGKGWSCLSLPKQNKAHSFLSARRRKVWVQSP